MSSHKSFSTRLNNNNKIITKYDGGLEKAIFRNSELLREVNDAFCKTHP